MSKKITSPHSHAPVLFSKAFKDVMEDASNIEVIYLHTSIHDHSKDHKNWRSSNLSLLSGHNASQLGLVVGKISCERDSAINVLLPEPDRIHVNTHFLNQRRANTKLEKKMENIRSWYVIVVENNLHQAIMLLIESNPTWSSFSWIVTSIRSGLSIKR